jgi:hypothetical protein
MELDDFKNTAMPDKEPGSDMGKSKMEGLDSFIEELKAADAKDRKNTRMFIIILGLFVVIYSSSLIRFNGTMRDGFATLVLGFALALSYLLWRYRQMKKIDYSAPSVRFLGEASQRYRFMRPVDWIITVPLLLILIAGGGILVYVSFLKYFGPSPWPLAIYSVFMAAAIYVGFRASIRIWKQDKKGILEKIRKMQQEFAE